MTVRGYPRADQRQRPSSRDRNAAIDCQHRLYSPRTIGTVLLGAFDDLTTVGWLPSRQLLMVAGEYLFAATMRDVAVRAMSLVLLASAILGLAGCGPSERDDFKFGWFYRMIVELDHGDEPLNIEVIIACGSQVRQILGEGRSARSVWAPYIYGVRASNGEGVLVQSPNVCNRELAKQPMPSDFLPVVFLAPDASNLEFMIAYLHEQAYAQPFSKLRFHNATFTEVSRADYDTWRRTKWKENIVPIGDRNAEYLRGTSFFRGEGFFPQGDPRNAGGLRMYCHSFIRTPLPDAPKETVRSHWPANHPRYWLLDWAVVRPILTQYGQDMREDARRLLSWDHETLNSHASFTIGKGVNRRSGIGHIEDDPGPFTVTSGKAPRIPYWTETGFPWASQDLFTRPSFRVQVDTANGADQGFAYCYRDVFAHYFPRPQGGEVRSVNHRIFIDGGLIGTWPGATRMAPGGVIVENDEYLWLLSYFDLTHELARMQ
jgi:hypothetical protein